MSCSIRRRSSSGCRRGCVGAGHGVAPSAIHLPHRPGATARGGEVAAGGRLDHPPSGSRRGPVEVTKRPPDPECRGDPGWPATRMEHGIFSAWRAFRRASTVRICKVLITREHPLDVASDANPQETNSKPSQSDLDVHPHGDLYSGRAFSKIRATEIWDRSVGNSRPATRHAWRRCRICLDRTALKSTAAPYGNGSRTAGMRGR